MFGTQPQRGGHVRGGHRDRVHLARQHAPQRDADGQHVDDLLHDRARRWWQQAGCGGEHRDQRQTHADQDGLQGDPLGASGDEDGVGQGVDPVDREHHVGGLRGCRRPARGQCHPDPGGGERRGVVDAVADHDRRAMGRLALDRGELVCRVAVGQHAVHAHDPPDHVRDVGAVAGDQHDAGDPGLAQRANHSGGVGPDRVLEQERAHGLRRRRRRTRSGSRPDRPDDAPGVPTPVRCRPRSTRPCPASPGGCRRCPPGRSHELRGRPAASPGPARDGWRR